MTQVWEYIKIALMNIRSNKGRSILTMLGIIIGISSVIMIISIGNGVKSGINGELNSMAGGQIAVYSNNTAENGTEVIFTEEDMDAIQEKVPNVKAVTPSWSFSEAPPAEREPLMLLQLSVRRDWNIRARIRSSRDVILPIRIIIRRIRSVSLQRAARKRCLVIPM